MALPGPAVFGPGSRGSLDEAGAEGREAAALAAAGVALEEEFMKTLEKTGPQLTSGIKGDWIGLYRQFLKSPNFDGWFKTRRKEMTQKLEALHLEALCEEDLLLWIQKHTERTVKQEAY